MRLLKLIARSPMFANLPAAGSSVQLLVFRQQILWALGPVRIGHDAALRTHQLALRLVLGADAFGAFHRIDDVDPAARRNRLVRADRLAGIASRARFGDHQGHGVLLALMPLRRHRLAPRASRNGTRPTTPLRSRPHRSNPDGCGPRPSYPSSSRRLP